MGPSPRGGAELAAWAPPLTTWRHGHALSPWTEGSRWPPSRKQLTAPRTGDALQTCQGTPRRSAPAYGVRSAPLAGEPPVLLGSPKVSPRLMGGAPPRTPEEASIQGYHLSGDWGAVGVGEKGTQLSTVNESKPMLSL